MLLMALTTSPSHNIHAVQRLCPYVRMFSPSPYCRYIDPGSRLEFSFSPNSLNPPRGRGSGQRYDRVVTDRQSDCASFLCCCDRRSDGGRNGDRCRYVAGSNRAQLLSPISIRLPPAAGPVEGGQMGGGGGHEQHTSSAPGLHGGRLPVTDTGIYVPRASHWEMWVWQGVSSQVERRLCPES